MQQPTPSEQPASFKSSRPERARSATSENAWRQQVDILAASERFVAASSADDVVCILRETARAAIGADGIAVVLKVGDRCSYVAEDAVSSLWEGQSFLVDDCVSGWAMRHGKTVVINDIRLDARVPQEAYAATFVRSLVMAPIGSPEPVAALGAYWSTVMTHDEDTVSRVERLARLATIAVENARLAQARDRASALSQGQARILALAVEEAPLGLTLDGIVREVEALSKPDVIGSILLLDPDGARLRHGAGPSLPAAYKEAIDGILVGSAFGSCGTAVFLKQPVFVSDIASDPLWANFREVAHNHGLCACWSIPIRSPSGEVLGVFAMYHRTAHQSGPSDLELLEFVARTAAIVIARARTEAALRESEARLRFFSEMDERLFTAADASCAMLVATEMLGRRLSASRCAYADVDNDTNHFWIRSDYNAPGIASSVGSYSLDLFGPRAATDMREGRVLLIRNVSAELAAGEGCEMFQAIGIGAIICCPLIKDGRLTAMMAVHQDCPRDWQSSEIALVREVVERCWSHVERVGAEARLRESEERLRLAVDNAELGFWDVDVINDRLIWPPRTKAMFGISADVSVTMEDFYAGLHPDDFAATASAYLAASDPNKRALYDVEYRTVGKEDGIERWVAAKGRGVFDGEGRCLRIAGTAVEITGRRRAEEALRELNATLEARVAKAVAEREQVQEALRQSQKMEAMGQLTGGVAHDFNNLLTPIVGSLDLLQRKGVGGEREQRLIAAAMQSAERARTLVQRLLAFARRQPLQSVAVNVAKLIQGMGELVESTIGPQISVIVEASDDLPRAKADPNQLEMAVLNLSVNARDAMPDGGTLRLSATAETISSGHRAQLRPGNYVCLTVADTGVGMAPQTLARAIEPFFSTKGIGKGTGLGLSMVHGLAAQLGGGLTISSRLGTGTSIALWLPASDEVVNEKSGAPHNSQHAEPILNGKVLLVEDEELVRVTTADMLSELGYVVVEAASAEAALQLLHSDRLFDVVITDHLMPGMTGTDLAQHAQVLRPGLPILLVSGYSGCEGIQSDLPRLTKPFRKHELVSALHSAILTHGK